MRDVTDSVLNIYRLMMSVNIGIKRRWERLSKASSVMGTGCVGSPLRLMTLMAPIRWSVQSLMTLSGMG